MKNDKLFSAFDGIDDDYLSDAAPRGRRSHLPVYRIAVAAACLTLVVGAMLIPSLFGETVEPPEYNTDPAFFSVMLDYLSTSSDIEINMGSDTPGEGGPGSPNGNYMEITDNQVEGIVEGDLAKATDKYLFRLGSHTIYVYSIDGDDSQLISKYTIPHVIGESSYTRYYDMFLSEDGRTLTLFSRREASFLGKTVITSIDVSNVRALKVKNEVIVGGEKSIVRRIGDKFYLMTQWIFQNNRIDLDLPESFIPSVDYPDGKHICAPDKIIYPDKLSSVYYQYLTVLNERDLSLSDEIAVMSSGNIHFTEGHIIFDSQYYKKEAEGDRSFNRCYSKIGVLSFSGNLKWIGDITVRGWSKDQYSFDERDSVLRMVLSTSDRAGYLTEYDNVSLYVYDLKTLEQITAVEEFAPEGEGATAVRFEGDRLYVCTAEIKQYTDPVYFFDLSDYNNITQVNTGFIDGFSSSLIDFGEGYLLGVGREDDGNNKVEVYRREGDQVISVDKYLFGGNVSTQYKSFLIDREKNLFGLSVAKFSNDGDSRRDSYVIFRLDGERLSLVGTFASSSDFSRAFENDGFIYITLPNSLYVVNSNGTEVCAINTAHSLGDWELKTEATCGERGTIERTCSCGRVETMSDFRSEPTPHELEDGICTLCKEDVGSAKKNAELIIYTSRGDGTCYVSGTKDVLRGVVEIPARSPKGEIVNGIGKNAFSNSGITEITLPDGIVIIDDNAFYTCPITDINFPKNLIKIGKGAFRYCDALNEVIVPDGVTEIGMAAFYGCSSLERVRLPDGLSEISYGLFNQCVSLTSVEIPDSVRVIADYGFNLCQNLRFVKIPDGVRSLGIRAFGGCKKIAGIDLGAGVNEIGAQAFDECTALVEIINRSPLNITIGSEEHGGIALYAKSVRNSGESSLKEIDGYTFLLSENINVLVAYNGGDTVLHLPTLPDGAEYQIGNSAFYQQKEITEIYIPDGVTSIGDYAFRECYGLNTVTLPDSVSSIGECAFLNCYFTSFDMGDGVTSIGTGAFKGCSKLREINMSQKLVVVGEAAFAGCSVVDLEIPSTVRYIGTEAFYGCSALLDAKIPDGVSVIEPNAFRSCKSLVFIIIPDSVVEIKNAFYDCPTLQTVYYRGNMAQWNDITKAYNNGIFDKVNVIYNYSE